jgi:hypothetical protein
MLCLEGEALAKRLLVKFAVRLVLRRVGFVGALRLRFGAAWPRRSLSGWGAMAMSNPWDVPPIPVFGDEDKDETFIGVGMVMSRWESIEMILSVMYSVFALRPGDLETIREYGEPRMFQERLYGLRNAAREFFTFAPDQIMYATFERFAARVTGFAARRDEVAHGIVAAIQLYDFYQQRTTFIRPRINYWALIPPDFLSRKRGSQGVPAYVYTSVELRHLDLHLVTLGTELAEYRERLRQIVWRLERSEYLREKEAALLQSQAMSDTRRAPPR